MLTNQFITCRGRKAKRFGKLRLVQFAVQIAPILCGEIVRFELFAALEHALWFCNGHALALTFQEVAALKLIDCANHCKHQSAEENYFAQLDESNVDDYDFLQEVTRQETMRMLYVAIDQLPPQTRNVILLNLEGKTNPEVAEELGISVNTVKCLKKSAYETLRGTLSQNYFVILMFLLGE